MPDVAGPVKQQRLGGWSDCAPGKGISVDMRDHGEAVRGVKVEVYQFRRVRCLQMAWFPFFDGVSLPTTSMKFH
jgi:hypothetical protein